MQDDQPAEGRRREERVAGDPAREEAAPAVVSSSLAGRWRWLAFAAAAVALVAVVAVLASGGSKGGEVANESSPEYALQELYRAAERGDWDDVTRYLDVEAVALAYADAVLAHALGTEGSGSAGASSGGMGGSVGLGRDMQGRFAERFAETLQAAVQARELAVDQGGLSGVLLSPAPDAVTLIGDTEATATVSVDGTNGVERATLWMAFDGDHWRVVAVEGLSDLMGPLD